MCYIKWQEQDGPVPITAVTEEELMFKTFVAIVTAFVAANVAAVEITDSFLDAIVAVESGGNASAIGDNGNAYGAYQIHESYVNDVNRISGKNFTHADAFDKKKAKEMVKIYLTNYGKNYEKKTGNTATNEVLARIHNGGPNGWKKTATQKYWNKVQKELK